MSALLGKRAVACVIAAGCLSAGTVAHSSVYVMSSEGDDLIGHAREYVSRYEDDFGLMADRFDVGFLALAAANPDLNPSLPGEGAAIQLPVVHVLPDAPRHGIVINLPELRLYYFSDTASEGDEAGGDRVYTFPIGIGKSGWETPVTQTVISRVEHNPAWVPPRSIVEEYRKAGLSLPAVVPAGPDNPLGEIALRLALPGYLLHGTNDEAGVGMRVSHGCLRLRNRDIATLASLVGPNTPVSIVNQPLKVGWSDGDLYLEAHRPLTDVHHDAETDRENLRRALSTLVSRVDLSLSGSRALEALMVEALESENFFSGMPIKLSLPVLPVEQAGIE